MTVYYIIYSLIILIGFTLVMNRRKINGKTENYALGLSCFILLFFAMLRGQNVGADTFQYQMIFQLCGQEKWENLATSTLSYSWYRLKDNEIGYKIINKLLYTISPWPQTITIFCSIILIFFVYYFINSYSKDKWLSILAFFCLGYYQLSLNLTPSAIASYIAMCGLGYVQERKLWKYLLCVFVATIFHYSALAFLLFYPISSIKMNKKKFWTLILGGFVIGFIFYSPLINLLIRFVPTQYKAYLRGSSMSEQLLVYLVQAIIISYCLFKSKRDTIYQENGLLLWLFILESFAYFISMHANNFTRVAFLFSPVVLVLIPNLIKDDRLMKNGNVKKTELVIVFGIVATYLLRVQINNIGKTIPYMFFWE